MSQIARSSIYLDKSHPQKNGECRVSIRITHNRKRKYYSTPHSLTSFEFYVDVFKKNLPDEEVKALIKPIKKRSRDEYKEIELSLHAYEDKAVKVIKNLPFFTFELFEKRFLTNRIENDTISNSFDSYIELLRRNDQIGTAVSYGCAKKSLQEFNDKLKFTDVTPELLRKYERWMIERERSVTTLSMYLRHLRTIFNNAISNQLIPKEVYPFGKNRYEIPTGNKKKKAITLPEIGLIYNHKIPAGTTRAMARDYWFFMYLCNGMNMKDMCLLKYKNIKGNILEFERAKTKRTKRNVELIRAVITEDVKRIIDTYGNKKRDPGNYIFPVLRPGLTEEKQRQLIQQITHLVNDHTKEIAKELGITKNLTTYAARHSFATILQRSGASTSFISESLGHSSEKTTKNYLEGFEDNQKAEIVKVLTAFKKEKSESK
ncbi:MAG: phage integrase SAM-like domain-containing protein [Ginsengibacter sp.]